MNKNHTFSFGGFFLFHRSIVIWNINLAIIIAATAVPMTTSCACTMSAPGGHNGRTSVATKSVRNVSVVLFSAATSRDYYYILLYTSWYADWWRLIFPACKLLNYLSSFTFIISKSILNDNNRFFFCPHTCNLVTPLYKIFNLQVQYAIQYTRSLYPYVCVHVDDYVKLLWAHNPSVYLFGHYRIMLRLARWCWVAHSQNGPKPANR